MHINRNYDELMHHITTTSSSEYIYVMLDNLQNALKSMNSQNSELVKYTHLKNNVLMYEIQSLSQYRDCYMIFLFFSHTVSFHYCQEFSNNIPHMAVLLKEFFILSNKNV